MLRLVIEGDEGFNDTDQTFIDAVKVIVDFEHSLVSLSKWESIYQKPFLSKVDKTHEEMLTYLRCMAVTPDLDPDVFGNMTQKNVDEVQVYIDSSQSATTFGLMPERRGQGEVITSELIYYWMIAFNIPFECQHWHLNRLFSLIKICNIKNSKPKKMSKFETAQRNRELNEQRKKAWNTSG